MSSSNSVPFIVVDLTPSRILITTLGVFHLLAMISLSVITLSLWITLPLGIGVVLSFGWYCQRYGNSRSPWFIEQVRLMPDGQWFIRTADGRVWPVRLVSSYAHPSVLILNFGLNRFVRRSVIMPPDAADGNAIRRLRVWLRTREEEEEA